MATKNSKVDHYIDNSAEFAKPILEHLRYLVISTLPEIKEEIKWGMPAYVLGKSILFSIAGFKQHCRMSFWLGGTLNDEQNVFVDDDCNSTMRFLRNIRNIEELPSNEIIIDLIKQSAAKSQEGVKSIRNTSPIKTELIVPEYFTDALKQNLVAQEYFQNFTPGRKKEYVQWINEAKTEATRNKRLQTAIEWISEGKARNWKYEKC